MPSSFPTAYDTLSNPTGTTEQADPTLLHSVQHGNVNDIIEAIQAKLGIGASAQAPVANRLLGGNGAGQTSYRQVVAADIAANTITAGNIDFDTINEYNIAAGAIGTSELKDANVTMAKIASRAVTSVVHTLPAPVGGMGGGAWVYTSVASSITGLTPGSSYVLAILTQTVQFSAAGAIGGIGIGIDTTAGPSTYTHFTNVNAAGSVVASTVFIGHLATAAGHNYYGLAYCNAGTMTMTGWPCPLTLIAFHR